MRTRCTKPSADRLAPPTSAPFTSFSRTKPATLSAVTLPPYSSGTSSRGGGAEDRRQYAPDVRHHRLCVVGGCRPARPDGPHRLVGDHETVGRLRKRQRPAELALHDRLSRCVLALLESLADTYDGPQPGPPRRADLLPDHVVSLAEDQAALRVADDHELAQLAEHRPRDLARKGARVLVVQVLRCQGDACAPQQPANSLQSDERRADDRFHALDLFRGPEASPPRARAPRRRSCSSSSCRR